MSRNPMQCSVVAKELSTNPEGIKIGLKTSTLPQHINTSDTTKKIISKNYMGAMFDNHAFALKFNI